MSTPLLPLLSFALPSGCVQIETSSSPFFASTTPNASGSSETGAPETADTAEPSETAETADTGFVCDPTDIPAGASYEPPPVSCPFAPDAVAIADCAASGSAALLGGVGYPTVQAAIDAAASGDTVTVCPGVHAESLTIDDSKLLVAADPTEGATVVDTTDLGRTGLSVRARDATLRGLTVTNALVLWGASEPLIASEGAAVVECVSAHDARGNAIAHSGGSLTVRHSRFDRGADTALIVEDQGALVVEDTAFSDNVGVYTYGGAIYATGALTLRRSRFTRNEADGDWSSGGAVHHAPDALPTTLVEDCWFVANVSDGGEGALAVGPGDLVVTGSTFVANSVRGGLNAAFEGPACRVSDSTFRDHTSTYPAFSCADTTTLERVRFEDNDTILRQSDPHVITGSNVVALRNTADHAAVELYGNVSFDCTCCDFGAGADDNQPADLLFDGVATDDLPTDFSL